MAEYNLSSLALESKGLFSLLDAQFEDFNPMLNTTTMSIPAPKKHPIVKILDIKPNDPWAVAYQHIPMLNSYCCTGLSIPQSNGLISVFRRPISQPRMFMPFESDGTTEKLLLDANKATRLFSPELIGTILGEAGLPLGFAGNVNPVLINRQLAELKFDAINWKSEDRKIVPVWANTEIEITRTIEYARGLHDSSIELTAIKNTVNHDRTRNQMIISFRGLDYFVKPPTISGRVLEPKSPIPDEEDRIIEKYNPPYSAKLVASMASFLVNDLV